MGRQVLQHTVHHEQHHRPPKNMVIYYLLHSEAVSSMHTARPLYGMSNRSMCNFIKNSSSNLASFWRELEIYNIK